MDRAAKLFRLPPRAQPSTEAELPNTAAVYTGTCIPEPGTERPDHRQTWRELLLLTQQLSFYLDHSRLGRIWDLLDTALSIVQVSLFVWSTTAVGSHGQPLPLGLGHRVPYLLVAVVLLAQFAARHILLTGGYMSWFMALTILDTIPPIIAVSLSFTSAHTHASYLSAGVFVLFYPLCFVRLQRSLAQLLAPGQSSLVRLTEFQRKLLLLSSDIVTTLLAVAAALHTWLHHFSAHELEQGGKEFNYFDALFFCSVSITAGPSEDIIPDLLITRLVVMLIITLAAVFLPAPVGEILTLMRSVSHFDNYSADPRTNHVLMCGHLDYTAVCEFLTEFYNQDHGLRIMHTSVVIVNPGEPSDELKTLLADPKYANRVRYFKGSTTSHTVLRTVRAHQAKAIFILAGKLTRSLKMDEDAETVMRALAIASYLSSLETIALSSHRYATMPWWLRDLSGPVPNAQPRVYSQTLLPETERFFRGLQTARVLSVEEFRMGLLAQSCATAGFATLMHLLTTTVTTKAAVQTINHLTQQVSPAELDWIGLYLHCATQEIYETRFPVDLIGRPYRYGVQWMYRRFGVVLFAVGISRTRAPRATRVQQEFHEVYLNPTNHVIRAADLAFLIAQNSSDVDRVRDHQSPAASVVGLSLPGSWIPTHRPTTAPPKATNVHSTEPVYEMKTLSTDAYAPPVSAPKGPSQPFVVPTDIPISPALSAKIITDSEVDPDHPPSSGSLLYSPTFEIRQKVARKVRKFAHGGLSNHVNQRKRRVLQQNNPFPNDLADHIIIADASPSFPRNVEYLVQSLKTAYSNDQLPIVILAQSQPSRLQALTLRDFANVYVVEGTPLSAADLSRTYVGRARGLIVLSNTKHYTDSSRRMADSSSVLAERNLWSFQASSNRFAVYEVIHRANIKYLDGAAPLDCEDLYTSQLLRPSFMEGHIFMPSMLDVMMSHSYFNPHILDVFKHLIFSHEHFTTPRPSTYPPNAGIVASPPLGPEPVVDPYPARPNHTTLVLPSGPGLDDNGSVLSVYSTPSSGSTSSSPTTKPATGDATEKWTSVPEKAGQPLDPMGGRDQLGRVPVARARKRISRGRIFMTHLPTAYVATAKNYGQLVTDMLYAHAAVTLGLYRNVKWTSGSHQKCVFINPPTDTPLQVGDQVYLIAQTQPQWPTVTFDDSPRPTTSRRRDSITGVGQVFNEPTHHRLQPNRVSAQATSKVRLADLAPPPNRPPLQRTADQRPGLTTASSPGPVGFESTEAHIPAPRPAHSAPISQRARHTQPVQGTTLDHPAPRRSSLAPPGSEHATSLHRSSHAMGYLQYLRSLPVAEAPATSDVLPSSEFLDHDVPPLNLNDPPR